MPLSLSAQQPNHKQAPQQYLDLINREADGPKRFGANHQAGRNLRNQRGIPEIDT